MFRSLIQSSKLSTDFRFTFDEVIFHHQKGFNWLLGLIKFFTPTKVNETSKDQAFDLPQTAGWTGRDERATERKPKKATGGCYLIPTGIRHQRSIETHAGLEFQQR